MNGRHITDLVYVYELADGTRAELEVGEVACVPRKGDFVVLPAPERHSFRVELVTWDVVHLKQRDVYDRTPYTVVRVALSRCP